MAMAGKAERRMMADCRDRAPGWPDRFSASHGTMRKDKNVESKNIGLVNE